MPAQADINIYQGDDYAAEVAVANADGTPADLSTAIATAQIRTDVADRAATVVLSITTSIAGPLVSLSIPGTATLTLTKPVYYWDLQLKMADASIITILRGKVAVTQEITRP